MQLRLIAAVWLNVTPLTVLLLPEMLMTWLLAEEPPQFCVCWTTTLVTAVAMLEMAALVDCAAPMTQKRYLRLAKFDLGELDNAPHGAMELLSTYALPLQLWKLRLLPLMVISQLPDA
jgi:hypothetical protein